MPRLLTTNEPLSPYLKRRGWDTTLNALYEARQWCGQAVKRRTLDLGTFLKEYQEALDSAVQRAENMREWGNDPQSPDYFFSPERLRKLKALYELADPKLSYPYGKPACISWFYWKGLY